MPSTPATRDGPDTPDEPRPAQEPLTGPGGALLEDSPPGVWVPDVLEGFERLTIPLEVDEEGPNAATLVRVARDPASGDRAAGRLRHRIPVLYVHGWSDYFYNAPLARLFEERGYAFHALDLRKYGRSLRPGQTPGWAESLQVYDDEIGSALRLIAGEHPEPPVLMGHSTGGLTLSLWADRHPGRARALLGTQPGGAEADEEARASSTSSVASTIVFLVWPCSPIRNSCSSALRSSSPQLPIQTRSSSFRRAGRGWRAGAAAAALVPTGGPHAR